MAVFELKKMDLFDMPQGWWLTHCVSADFEMGAGIAKQFRAKFNGSQEYLRREFPFDMDFQKDYSAAIIHSNVVYLVTKAHYYDKPTYKSLQSALNNLREAVKTMCIHKLAMPKIGCGLDKLDWEIVKKMIETTFENDNDLEIVICYQ